MVRFSNSHLVYALTWFGLALMVVGLRWLWRYESRLRAAYRSHPPMNRSTFSKASSSPWQSQLGQHSAGLRTAPAHPAALDCRGGAAAHHPGHPPA